MDELDGLKNQILDDLISIIDEDGVEPEEKAEIVMARYYSNGDTGLLRKAYEVARSIEDKPARGNVLMRILDEINISQAEATEDARQPESGQGDQPQAADSQSQDIQVQQG